MMHTFKIKTYRKKINKLLLVSLLLLFPVVAQSQNFNITATQANILGDVYDISVNTVSTPGCSARRIEVQIPSGLEYVSSAVPSSSGWVIDPATTATSIIKFNNPSSSGGGSENFVIRLKFRNGVTCDNIEQTVTARLFCSSPNNPIAIADDFVKLTSQTENRAKATISQIFPSVGSIPQTMCLGNNVVKYRIEVTNGLANQINTYNLKNTKVEFQLASCASLVNVYPINSSASSQPTPGTTPNSYRFDVSSGNSMLNVDEVKRFDVYVTYKCVTCANNTNISHPSVSVSGKPICQPNTTLTSSIQNCNPLTFIGNATCNTCTAGTPAIDQSYITFPCPSGCSSVITITYDIDLPPTLSSNGNNNSNNNEIFLEADIPSGLGIPTYSASNSPQFLNGSTWVNTISAASTKVRWKYSYNSNSPTLINAHLSFQSSNLQTVQPIFKYRVINNNNQAILLNVDNKTAPHQQCQLNVLKLKKIKKQLEPDTSYTTTIFAAPSEIMTYRLTILNNGSGALVNTKIEDLLNAKHTYLGNFKYCYSTSSSPIPASFTNLNTITNSITDIPELGAVAVETTSNVVRLSGFVLPKDCPPNGNKYLTIEFDVKVNSNVLSGNIIPNSYSVKSDGIEVNGGGNGNTTITISDLFSVKPSMLVKCPYPTTNQWSNSIKVKEGDIVDFKMQFINDGSKPIKLTDLINLKPQLGDKFELGTSTGLISRGSTCQIDYNCSPIQIISSPTSVIVSPIYSYSTNTVNMARTMLTPSSASGDAPNFTKPCNGANWMKINFNNNTGLVLNPGDKIEVIYQGKIISSPGTVAYNSFSFNAVGLNGQTILSDNSYPAVKIINDGTGCQQPPAPCIDCTSFDLIRSAPNLISKYVVSAWVKEEYTATPQQQFKKFDKGCLSVSFTDVSGLPIGASQKFYASGEIIDGWQRIIGEFEVPANVDDMFLELLNENTDSKMVYFDDIRVLPNKGNMKSFVYDQKTQRLMAELDENNYSTFYEYDLEGGLIRIKKETEKGVFTIQETRSGNVKSEN